MYAKITGDIPSLKVQTKEMIKGVGALTQLAMQIANAAIQPYQIEEESSEEEESDSFEVQTDN